jgi:hypothetical protein
MAWALSVRTIYALYTDYLRFIYGVVYALYTEYLRFYYA